jgi:CubicO group peptidase (beta-lactamase class C family)
MKILLKKPGLTLFVVIVLTLCIGVSVNSRILSFVRALFAFATPREAAPREPPGQEWIDREFAASGAPSLTMAVAQDGRFLWERSWGWADKEKRILATPQTMYSLASISKPITATGLMVLVERGQIDLDKPIDDYLGAIKLRAYVGDAQQATVRRVANHTAGLPIHENFFYVDEDRRLPSFAETIRRYGVLVRPPGERFEYSNLGYGLLEQAIAQTSKQDFAAFMRREVFEPLGLSRMALGIPVGMQKETATRYALTGSPLPFYDFDARGASAFYASAHDLARFAFLSLGTLEEGQRRILSGASMAAMTQPTASSPFSVGWQLYDRSKSHVVFATGSMAGVGTIVITVPAKRFVVVGLCNAGTDFPVRVAIEIIRRAFPDLGFTPPLGPPPPPPEPIPNTLVGDWVGEVVTHNGRRRFHLWIQVGGDVYAQLGDQPRVQISNAQWSGGQLIGSFSGDIGVDGLSSPQRLGFRLTPRSELLDGPITAWISQHERTGNALSSFLSLQRGK